MIDPSKSHIIVDRIRSGGGVAENGEITIQQSFLCVLNKIKNFTIQGWETKHLPKCEDCREREP